jgi:hypothetical protein
MKITVKAFMTAAALALLTVVSLGYMTQVRNMAATFYDDGKSCPGGCDSHVVFSDVHNGTGNAFSPNSKREKPEKCKVGETCMICFSSASDSCLEIMYRGAGPPEGRFDLTTTFLKENCERTDLPSVLQTECRDLQPKVDVLKRNINCFEEPDNAKCSALIAAARTRQQADTLVYDECMESGQTKFNQKYAGQKNKQRSNNCSYERFGTGRNSKGKTWRKLLPGACRVGTYVGRDGLDCCSNNLYAAATLGTECAAFFPKK